MSNFYAKSHTYVDKVPVIGTLKRMEGAGK